MSIQSGTGSSRASGLREWALVVLLLFVSCLPMEEDCELSPSLLDDLTADSDIGYFVYIESTLFSWEERDPFLTECGADLPVARGQFFSSKSRALEQVELSGGPPCSEWARYILPVGIRFPDIVYRPDDPKPERVSCPDTLGLCSINYMRFHRVDSCTLVLAPPKIFLSF